jgi:hypothetical protein
MTTGAVQMSKPFSTRLIPLLFLLPLLSIPPGLAAQQIRFSETAWVEPAVLLDLWARASWPDEGVRAERLEAEYFVNLSRLALRGQVARGLGFLVATGGERNFGSLEVWDAVALVQVSRAVNVDAGRVLLPFVRHAQQFNNDLQTHDFQRTAFMYPRGSTLRRRDVGVRVRGLLLGDAVDYRLAVTRGVDTGRGIPRFTGRLAVNGGRPEPGYVLPGIYLAGPAVLSAGLAMDLQPDVLEGGGSYRGVGADLFWSVPVRSRRVTGQAALLHYRGLNGIGSAGRPAVVARSGVGAVFDTGLLVGAAGPVVAVEWFRPAGAGAFDDHLLAANLGINWWLRGTAASLKLNGGLRKERGAAPPDADPVLTLQLQMRLPLPGPANPRT